MRDFTRSTIFYLYLVFCALVPNLVFGVSDFIQVVVVQISVCVLLTYHWYKRIDFSKVYSGEMSMVYKEIDTKQFEKTKIFNLGVKTKPTYANGYFDNALISKILSDRYDIFLLCISFIGEFAIFMTKIEGFKPRHSIVGLFFRDVIPVGKNIAAAFGGYIFLWSFSLFLIGLISRFFYYLDSDSPEYL